MSNHQISRSKTDRQNILNNPFALQNIQNEIEGVPFYKFEDKLVVLKQDVVVFFGVSERTIDRSLSQYSDELKQNGYEIIAGKRFVELKKSIGPDKFDGTNVSRIGVFDFRSFLNLSMVLSSSSIAKQLRTKILDIVVDTLHEKAGKNRKYINQRDETFLPSYVTNTEVRKTFTKTIKDCVEGNNLKYPYLTNLIYKDLFGENATEYRKLLKLGTRENLRHTFYREILDIVSGYEEGVTDSLKKAFNKKGSKLSRDEAAKIMQQAFDSPFLRVPKETARRLMASRDKAFREIIHEALLPYIEALPQEEYEKFLKDEAKVIEAKTKDFIEIVDKNKDVFDRLKDK